jgi:hypothetical protein
MEKQTVSFWAIIGCLLLAALVGGLVTKVAFPTVETVTNTKIQTIEVPAEPIVTEKIVTVEVPVEVVKEVQVVKDLDLAATFLTPAKEEFMNEVADDDDYLVCGGEEYDVDNVKISKIYDGYSVKVDDISDNEYTVAFKVKLKYLDADVEEKCYNTFDVEVVYPKDHDSDVDVEIA